MLKGREMFEARKNLGRAKIGKKLKLFAKPQDGLLGTQLPLQAIAGRIAHRAKQDCVRLARDVKRFGWQRVAVVLVSNASDISARQLKAKAQRNEQELGGPGAADPALG